MIHNQRDNIKRVLVLDVSGIYAQIYDQGYFDKLAISDIQKRYSDSKLWRVIVLD